MLRLQDKVFNVTWLLTTAILFLHCWRDIIYPQLAFEDRTYLLSLYFNAPGLPDITRTYNGYASVGPNLLAALLTKLPLTWIPRAFALASLMICALGLSLFSSTRYRWLLADDRLRQAACLLMAAMPLGQSLLISNLTYSQWNLLWILFLLLLQDPHSNRQQLLRQTPLVLLCIFSHPVSLLCILPCLARILLFPSWRQALFQGGYIAAAVFFNRHFVDAFHPSFEDIESRLWLALSILGGRGFLETFIGATAATTLMGNLDNWPIFMIAGLLLVVSTWLTATVALCKRHNHIAMMMLFFNTCFLVLLASTLTRFNGWGWKIHLDNALLQRYVYITRLSLFLTGCYALTPLLVRFRRWPVVNPVLFVCCLGFAVFASERNALLYRHFPQSSEELRIFLAATQQEIDIGNTACRQENNCKRTLASSDPSWPVTLDLSGK